MTLLTHFAGYPLLHALGWTLLHFCWQGALVAGMLWCVLGLLGGGSSQARYLAACVAMLLMVTLPVMTFTRIAVAEYQMRSAAQHTGVVFDMSIFLHAASGQSSAPLPQRIALGLDHAMPWLLSVWLLGALFFLVRLNVGLLATRRLKSVGTQSPSDELQQRFEVLRARLGVTRAVRLLHSARVQVPTVIGWLRPAVLIPVSCLTGLSAEQIEAIFCHELAHVRRHDYLVSVFQSLAEALLFYHPAVWWVSKQVRRERECCCDELAVANCGDALAYARALSYLEERRSTLPEFVLGANGGVLKMRIKRLLGYTDHAGAPQFAVFVLLAMVAAISASYMATLSHAQKTVQPTMVASVAPIGQPAVVEPEQAAPSENPGAPLRGIYKTWLTQDVLYIITPAERDVYLRLQNDNQRDAFIENFWGRRDTPGSEYGSYREAYYSRIAYANEHFANDTQPGWRTDRGHVYLVYGKPQSIDSHPGGGAYQAPTGLVNRTYPFEVWHYDTTQGFADSKDILFVDTCRCGEYNLTPDTTVPSADSSQGRSAAEQAATGTINNAPPPAHRADSIQPVPAYAPRPIELAATQPAPAAPASISAGPDLSCTYYSRSGSQPGTCGSSLDAIPVYSCRANEADQSSQEQSGCEWKVKRFAEWQQQYNIPSPTSPLRVSGSVMQNALLHNVVPVYPDVAKAAHVQGTVVLAATISADGKVKSLNVISGAPMLIPSAVDAVKQWVYQPFLLNGQPMEVSTTINVHYTYGESAAATAQPSTFTPAQVSIMNGQEPRMTNDSQLSVILPITNLPSRRNDAVSAPVGATTMPDGASRPVVLYAPEPEFTEEARKAKFMGVVLLNLDVNTKGVPQNVHVLRGVGMGLDAKAIEAVRQYRFKPAIKDGKPVEEAMNIEVNFQIF